MSIDLKIICKYNPSKQLNISNPMMHKLELIFAQIVEY